MLARQKKFIKDHILSKWRYRESGISPANDISFDVDDQSINSVTTDLTLHTSDHYLYIISSVASVNSGYYQVDFSASNTPTKIFINTNFTKITADQAAGTFFTIYPLICPIKWENSYFEYPEVIDPDNISSSYGIFLEYMLYPGYSKAFSKASGKEGRMKQRKEGWIKFLLHAPYRFGDTFVDVIKQKLISMFPCGSLGGEITVAAIDEGGSFKDDQKNYYIYPIVVPIKTDFDERELLDPYYNTFDQQGFPMLNFTLSYPGNTFEKFCGVHLNTTTNLYEKTGMSDTNAVSHIVIDRSSSQITLQNSGPVKYLAPHGFPVGEVAYLASGNPNITFTQPVSGKYQKLFEVPDAYTISISPESVVII